MRLRPIDGRIGTALAAAVLLTVPTREGVGAHNLLLGVHRLGHGHHQQFASEHKLRIHIPHVLVGGEVHDEGAHEAVVVLRHLPRRTIYIRNKTIAKTHGIDQGFKDGLAGLAVVVKLTIDVGTVAAHHRTAGSKLHPADIQFLILRVACSGVVAERAVGTCEETADVGVHLRVTRERVVQAEGNLLAQVLPAGTDVAAPRVGACTLLTCKIAAGEDEHALVLVHGALVVIDALHGGQRESVAHGTVGAALVVGRRDHLVEVALLVRVVVGIRGVHPPGIDAHLMQPREVFPIDVAGLGGVGGIDADTAGIVHARRPEG